MELIYLANFLFNKKLVKSCSWCVYGKKSHFTDEIFCKKHGVTDKRDYCSGYKYDPLKRKPDLKKAKIDFKPEDFKL